MELKAGYKRTEVGMIPKDWDVKLLVELTTGIGDGIHSTPQYTASSEFFFINGNNLIDSRIVITENTMCVSEAEYRRLRKRLSKRTILISINGTIGNLAFFDGETVVLGKSAAYINVAQTTDKEYVFYSLMSVATANYFEDELTGTTIRNLSLGSLRNTPIPVPKTLEEQRAIAAALSDVDALISALDKLIAKKRDIKQAAMQQLLTGKQRLPGFSGATAKYKQTEVGVIPEDWEVKRMGELFEITSSKRVFQSEWKTEGIPFYRARELTVLGEKGFVENELFISKEMYDAYKNIYGVPKVGDMLVTGVGTLGKVYVVSDDHEFYFKDGNIIWFKSSGRVRSDYVRQLYLTQLVTKQIENASAGTTVGTYTISGAKKTIIPLPPLSEQRAIAAVLSDMDAEIAALERKRDKTRALKQGMMQELLTGRTRLV